MTNKYLQLLERRAESKVRPISRVPLCLDPERYAVLRDAREALKKGLEDAVVPPGQPAKATKMADTKIPELRKAVAEAEESVREASINVVLQGRTQEEIVGGLVRAKAEEGSTDGKGGLTTEQRWKIIMEAFLRVEDLDGEAVPEITKSRMEELLPTLTSGELTMLYRGITLATESPDFPTSRR